MSDEIGSIAKNMQDSAPEPRVTPETESEASAPRPSFAAQTDSEGTIFDPAVHVTDAEGNPKKTITGKFRKRPGRKPQPSSGTIGRTPEESQGARAAAVSTVQGIQMLGLVVGGEEWAYHVDPRTGLNEEMAGIEAFHKYYEARGVTDIPPGVGIAIWSAAYAIPRLFQPKTKTRLARFGDWIKRKVLKRHARNDSRNDRKRENDVSNKSSEKTPGSGIPGIGIGPDEGQ